MSLGKSNERLAEFRYDRTYFHPRLIGRYIPRKEKRFGATELMVAVQEICNSCPVRKVCEPVLERGLDLVTITVTGERVASLDCSIPRAPRFMSY